MSTALLPYGQPLYWSFHERPEAWHIDPFHQYAQQLAFFGGGRFTKSSHYHDSSLYGNHGVLTNMDPATDWVRDLGRWALDFDGSDDYVNGSFSSLLDPLTYDFTVVAWIKTTDTAAAFFNKRSDAVVGDGNDRGWACYMSSNKLGFLLNDSTSNKHATSTSNINDGAWHCICGTRAGARIKVFFDGTEQDDQAGFTTSISSNRQLLVGNNIPFSAANYYAGLIVDLLIWRRQLMVSEHRALADPSNVMLSLGGSDPGLIVPDDLVYPVYLPSSVPAGAKPALWLGVCV